MTSNINIFTLLTFWSEIIWDLCNVGDRDLNVVGGSLFTAIIEPAKPFIIVLEKDVNYQNRNKNLRVLATFQKI